jgi:uncharacterized membrane protein SpoIIM required for sporulation
VKQVTIAFLVALVIGAAIGLLIAGELDQAQRVRLIVNMSQADRVRLIVAGCIILVLVAGGSIVAINREK